MGLEHFMECFRKSNKEATFRMNKVEFSLVARTILQQHGHWPGCRQTPWWGEAVRNSPASSSTSCHPPSMPGKDQVYWSQASGWGVWRYFRASLKWLADMLGTIFLLICSNEYKRLNPVEGSIWTGDSSFSTFNHPPPWATIRPDSFHTISPLSVHCLARRSQNARAWELPLHGQGAGAHQLWLLCLLKAVKRKG